MTVVLPARTLASMTYSSLLAESKEKLLAKFLAKEFTCVSHSLAAKLLGQPAA